MARRREIVEGKVYLARGVSRHRFRRVIAVIGERVAYNCGGDRNLWCSVKSFKRATRPEPSAVASCISVPNDLFSAP